MIGARTLAYQVLLHIDRKASHPDRLIRAVLDRHGRLEERDRALLTELVYGTLRWQGRLDWFIEQLSKVRRSKIAPAVRVLLRLGLYQILMLDRIPSHAAVNESVKIARSSQPPHVAGFVNAVLREAVRRRETRDWPPSPEIPSESLAVETSHPIWFVRKWIEEFGFGETRGLCRANNDVAPLVLRVNRLKADPRRVLEWLGENHVDAVLSPYLEDAVRVTGLGRDVSILPIFTDGWVQVQDEASQIVSHLVGPEPGERVLDLCSGFGGKTTHLGILMRNEGEILAVDRSAWKLEELKENAERQGIGIIRSLASDVLELSPDRIGKFDRVLVDAPCSGFGSIRRKPDIKWVRHPKDPFRYARIQKELLAHAGNFVKRGGALVYATCTVFREEDEDVAADFSGQHPDWRIEPAEEHLPDACANMVEHSCFRSWPHRHGVDGFFGARWRNRI